MRCIIFALYVPTSSAKTSNLRGNFKKKCDFKCPSHASRRPGHQCYDSFDDCRCDKGYVKKYGQCVKKDDHQKKCDFKCPSHASRRPGHQCYDSFDDCRC